ncbi:MAG: 6-phosphofructokinase [Lachnospirales bacterium]
MVLGTKKGKVAVLTSGGDAPGMNAAIRSVVRSALDMGYEVMGVRRGYQGLIEGDIISLDARMVGDIMDRGGTFLKTARSMEMMTIEGQKKAANILNALNVTALVVIGGDGSIRGALTLSKYGINVVGIAGTIDLDLPCTDYTIGFDTAINTCMESVNKIRDTSGSHERCSLVEVMGRNCGYLALWCGITGGAEEVIIPERKIPTVNELIQIIIENRAKGKRHNLIVVAEGVGGTIELAKEIQEKTGVETRATILGHLQRGGSPSAVDRMHASMMGNYAIEVLEKGLKNQIVIFKDGKYSSVDIEEGLSQKHEYDDKMYSILKSLSI